MSNELNLQNAPVIACDLNAIQTEQRGQHLTTAESIFSTAQEVRELDNGYALGLPLDTPMIYRAAEFIANERLCCPFFDFALEIESGSSMLWLHLKGGEGVKDFIRANLSDQKVLSF